MSKPIHGWGIKGSNTHYLCDRVFSVFLGWLTLDTGRWFIDIRVGAKPLGDYPYPEHWYPRHWWMIGKQARSKFWAEVDRRKAA